MVGSVECWNLTLKKAARRQREVDKDTFGATALKRPFGPPACLRFDYWRSSPNTSVVQQRHQIYDYTVAVADLRCVVHHNYFDDPCGGVFLKRPSSDVRHCFTAEVAALAAAAAAASKR